MKYLLDTCVISELAKKRPHEAVLRWMDVVEDADLFISSVTVGEIRKGIERLPVNDARRFRLEAWCNSVVQSFENRVISFDREVASEWGRIVGSSMREGRSRSLIDMQIAATAFRFGMVLVTRNTRDMEGEGVEVLNPFENKQGEPADP